MSSMFLLLAKTEGPGVTSLQVFGMYSSMEKAIPGVPGNFGPFKKSGFGNQRMLEARGDIPPKSIFTTDVHEGISFLLVEY